MGALNGAASSVNSGAASSAGQLTQGISTLNQANQVITGGSIFSPANGNVGPGGGNGSESWALPVVGGVNGLGSGRNNGEDSGSIKP